MTISVVAHDPCWARTFADLRGRLLDALDGVPVVAVEHVGSTSVPGLPAKPVLDIDVVVAPADVPAAIAALVAVGYEDRGTMGVPGRWSLGAPDGPARHTYVVEAGSLALRNHLAVREVLRADPDLRRRYGDVKLALARRYDASEIDRYVEGKAPILREILAAAGLDDAELDDIEEVNRA